MKTLQDCMDDMLDDTYTVTETVLEFVDADVLEGLLRAMYNSYMLKDTQSIGIFGASLAKEIDEKLRDRAQKVKDNCAPIQYDRNDMLDVWREEAKAL